MLLEPAAPEPALPAFRDCQRHGLDSQLAGHDLGARPTRAHGIPQRACTVSHRPRHAPRMRPRPRLYCPPQDDLLRLNATARLSARARLCAARSQCSREGHGRASRGHACLGRCSVRSADSNASAATGACPSWLVRRASRTRSGTVRCYSSPESTKVS